MKRIEHRVLAEKFEEERNQTAIEGQYAALAKEIEKLENKDTTNDKTTKDNA